MSSGIHLHQGTRTKSLWIDTWIDLKREKVVCIYEPICNFLSSLMINIVRIVLKVPVLANIQHIQYEKVEKHLCWRQPRAQQGCKPATWIIPLFQHVQTSKVTVHKAQKLSDEKVPYTEAKSGPYPCCVEQKYSLCHGTPFGQGSLFYGLGRLVACLTNSGSMQ